MAPASRLFGPADLAEKAYKLQREGWQGSEIAEFLAISRKYANNLARVRKKLCPPLLREFRDGELSFHSAMLIAREAGAEAQLRARERLDTKVSDSRVPPTKRRLGQILGEVEGWKESEYKRGARAVLRHLLGDVLSIGPR